MIGIIHDQEFDMEGHFLVVGRTIDVIDGGRYASIIQVGAWNHQGKEVGFAIGGRMPASMKQYIDGV